jgi:outer membrane biogenesis lipoprotein LolB
MGSNRPAPPGRFSRLALLLAILGAASCAGRPPILVPPPSGVDAVEGFAAASIAGAEASIKGKFAFLFRRPGLGRVEAVDPIGRTAFIIHFREGRAWFVLPSKKVYAEDDAEVMMRRFIGIALRPDDTLSLLSGIWPEGGEAGGWSVARDGQGRVAGGERDGFGFKVRDYFRGGAAPRQVEVSGAGTAGRIKVLKLAFNPAPRDEAFDTAFLARFAAKTWDELMELIDR